MRTGDFLQQRLRLPLKTEHCTRGIVLVVCSDWGKMDDSLLFIVDKNVDYHFHERFVLKFIV